MRTILFYSRFFLYLILAVTPFFADPAVAVAYDFQGKMAWLFLLPANMFIAYYLRPPRVRYWVGPVVAISLITLCVLAFSDFLWGIIALFVATGLIGYLSTKYLFSGRGPGLAVLEMFFFGIVYFKLLQFTRASPQIARDSSGLIGVLMVLAVVSFFVHGLIIYLIAFPDRAGKRRAGEVGAFALIVTCVLLVLSFALPNDFIQHNMHFNPFEEEPPPTPRDLRDGDMEGFPNDQGGARGREQGESGNGLPLGGNEPHFPSERNRGGTGSEQLENVPEEGTRPDENRGGGSGDEGPEGERGGQGGDDENSQGQSGEQQNNQGGGGGGSQPDGQGQSQGENQGEGQGQGQGEGQGQGQGEGQGQGQGEGQEQGENQGQGEQSDQRLEGIPADQWNNRNSMSGASERQFAVMVIASKVTPVYAAEEYRGRFEAGAGLTRTPETMEPLNKLRDQVLMQTWQDQITSADDLRQPTPAYYLSSLDYRVVAYRPFQIRPTVENTRYHPFDLSYNAISRVSMSGPRDWYLVRELNPEEEERFQEYLAVDLSPESEAVFRNHSNTVIQNYRGQLTELRQQIAEQNGWESTPDDWNVDELKYFEKVDALLRGFAEHQYQMGFSERTDVAYLADFLGTRKAGDCTEFANSVAILARMNNIPSRVVHGYLASRDLQTPAHRGGLRVLREKIEPLREFPLEEMYLVTSSHHHAWVQFYLPGFGWIDFEPTAHAIPPEPGPGTNPNDGHVVIPLIEEETIEPPSDFNIPWKLVGMVTAILAATILTGLYTYRLGRELFYLVLSGRRSRRGMEALLMYLLLRMAREGHRLKGRHETPLEFAEQFPAIQGFADHYTMLRFREIYYANEEEKAWQELKEAHRAALRDVRSPGFRAFFRRIFTLRGIQY